MERDMIDVYEPIAMIENIDVWYGKTQALKAVNMIIKKNAITAFIGPSGCGKSTLLRSINRMNDIIPSFRLSGSVQVENEEIYAKHSINWVNKYRRKIGMVFQESNPLPISIIDNLTLPLFEHLHISKAEAQKRAIEKLKMTYLYDEVADKLNQSALRLSGGQQQRLCIARALMIEPSILLLDEPCAALDPISTYKIEDLLLDLKKKYSIIMVTHNMEQASRIADETAFFYLGEMLEFGPTSELFQSPKNDRLARYLGGSI